MLIKRSNKITNYVLPVYIKNKTIKINWYYDNEYILYSAYRQLKTLKIDIIPLYPIIY